MNTEDVKFTSVMHMTDVNLSHKKGQTRFKFTSVIVMSDVNLRHL